MRASASADFLRSVTSCSATSMRTDLPPASLITTRSERIHNTLPSVRTRRYSWS